MTTPPTNVCGACGKLGSTLKCGNCYDVHYCDATCQKAHWKTHKLICNTVNLVTCPIPGCDMKYPQDHFKEHSKLHHSTTIHTAINWRPPAGARSVGLIEWNIAGSLEMLDMFERDADCHFHVADTTTDVCTLCLDFSAPRSNRRNGKIYLDAKITINTSLPHNIPSDATIAIIIGDDVEHHTKIDSVIDNLNICKRKGINSMNCALLFKRVTTTANIRKSTRDGCHRICLTFYTSL